MFVFPPEIDTTSGVPDPKPPSSAADVFNTTLQAADETGLLGRERSYEAAVDRRNDAIFKATGERLENPMRVYQLDVPEGGILSNPRDPFAVDTWHQKLQELSERYPQYRDIIRPDVTMYEDGPLEVQRSTAAAADAWDRAPNSFSSYVAYAGASLVSMPRDPLLWVTGPLFPEGRALAGAGGVAWQALKIGAANAGLTAAEQPFIQAWRKEAGLDYGVASALEETAASFLAGAVLEGGVRGGWRGFRALQGKSQVLNEAGEVIGYSSPIAGDMPSVSRPPATGNPLQALDDAASAAPEGSLIRKAQAGDREALATLAEKTGLHEQPEVRAALEVLVREEAERTPPAGVAVDDHLQRFNDAMRGAQDPRALPPGDALMHATEVTAAPERIAEVMSQNPIELAAEIRETPELLQEGLPWQDPQLRAAAHLSRLDDGAFDLVAGGEARPLHGAIVAEHVADADRHAGLLRQLAETDPKTPQETRARLSELLAGPKDEATHARVAGVSEDLADRPVILVDDPYGRDAARQLEQLRQAHAAEIEAAGGTIAKAVETGTAETGQALARLEKKVDAVISAHDRLAAALDRAIGRLPEGVKVKSFADVADLPEALRRDVLAARSAGGRVEALTERQTGNVWIAADALDVDGTLSHETIHALRQVGVLSDVELQVLADKAAEFPDLFDVGHYADVYAGRMSTAEFKDAMLQEAAAHLYEARANGANFGKDANAILRKIKQFLERARNALQGLGWQNADDIMKAIDDGAIAARARRKVEMPGGGEIEGLPLFSQRDVRVAKSTTDSLAGTAIHVPPELTSWLGVEHAPFQANYEAIARKRVARPSTGIDLSDPKAVRDLVEDVLTNASVAIKANSSRGANWDLIVRNGADKVVGARLELRGRRYLVDTALVYDKDQFERRLSAAVRIGGRDFVKWRDASAASTLLEVIRREVALADHPSAAKLIEALTASQERDGGGLFSLKAYHGTPHEVDRFSSEKIGTGEGAQAYGHGLYFAENEAVAVHYARVLSSKPSGIRWPPEIARDPRGYAEALMHNTTNTIGNYDAAAIRARALATLDAELNAVRSDGILRSRKKERALAEARSFIESGDVAVPPRGGHLYEVEIDAEPEHFLDWDKPFGEQTPLVQRAMREAGQNPERPGPFGTKEMSDLPVGQMLTRQLQDPKHLLHRTLREAGVVGVRYLDGSSRRKGAGNSNFVIFDDSKIKITHVDGQPVTEPSQTGGALFSLRDDARAQLQADLEEAAAIADAKAKAQRERQALIDEGIRKQNERFVTTLRDARGQVDPAKALVYLIENHGEVDLPAGMTSVAAEQKAVEAMAKASMEELLHTFRPQLGTGKTRQTARLTNVIRELAGEGTGDASAKGLAQAWIQTSERLRQEFNASGGDIPKLEGWFLPQVHDRGALLGAGKTKWVNDIFKQLDLKRILDGETRQPLSPPEIRAALGDIWENITSDGHGTQAANASDPFGGITADATGAKKLANQRQEHRFLHFKSADAWLDYQKQYGGGADPFRAMMQHITSMSKDIAAMRVLGTNPNRELARLAKFAAKQAALARPAAVLIDEAVAKVQDLTERYLAAPTRLSEVNDRIGTIHKQIAGLREKRMGPPSKRNKRKIEALRDELFRLDTERLTLIENGKPRVDGLEGAELRQQLQDAYDELGAVQDVDKVLFPKKTEVLGKTMTRGGFWTTAPEDYARAYINRAEAMWDLYRGVTSAPVNVKAAQAMQTLRNVGVIGRGGSMVISSIADNFTQVMARRFTGLPAYKTFTDILAQFGPNATREAHRQGLIGETYLHMFNDGARGAASVHGAEWSNYLAERTIALQGLGKLTDAQRQGFGMSVQASFADLAGKTFDEIGALNPRLQKLLQRYGLDAADWDAIRLNATTKKPREIDFLSPNLVRDDLEANDAASAARRVAERYLGMILQETDFASPTAMLRTRAMMVGKTRPGTLVGELLRTGGQFKSFAFMYWMLHAERALREGIANGALKGASYAAQVVTVTTLGGALVVQLKDLKGGKDPRPVDRPGFWYAALTQGGGLGIWGDLLNSEQNRFGGGLVSTLGGPVVGIAEDVMGAAGLSGKTTARRGQARLATGYVPGSSLWYLNLAWQRIAAESLQRQLDPTAYDAFRRRQQQQMKDYGNGFWWAPGQTAPGRGPRVN